MTIIELKAVDQKLEVVNEPIVASDNVDSVKIHVGFSEEWGGYAKSAVFFAAKNLEGIYEEVMTDDECIVPHEVLDEADSLFIGVRGVIASTGAVKTSTLVKYRIEEGTPAGTGTSVEPSANVYQQLLSKTDLLEKRLVNILTAETVDGEVKDVRLGADGKTYQTAGEAVRKQFESVKNAHDRLSSYVDQDRNDISKNTTAIEEIRDSRFRTTVVTTNEVVKDNVLRILNVNDGDSFDTSNSSMISSFFTYSQIVNKGDVLVFDGIVSPVATQHSDGFVVLNDENVVLESVKFADIAERKYMFENSGVMYFTHQYPQSSSVYNLFSIKTLLARPLVLYASNYVEYEYDPKAGDEAVEAILSGRQILIRTPNADGGVFTACYSPIMFYQLPNVDNNYLYLFYLKDEKQNIDLSAIGLGVIQIPVYGQIKMKLSKTYSQTPLK